MAKVSRDQVKNVIKPVLRNYVAKSVDNDTRAQLQSALDIAVDQLILSDSSVKVDLRQSPTGWQLAGQVGYSIDPESSRMERIDFHFSNGQYFIGD